MVWGRAPGAAGGSSSGRERGKGTVLDVTARGGVSQHPGQGKKGNFGFLVGLAERHFSFYTLCLGCSKEY